MTDVGGWQQGRGDGGPNSQQLGAQWQPGAQPTAQWQPGAQPAQQWASGGGQSQLPPAQQWAPGAQQPGWQPQPGTQPGAQFGQSAAPVQIVEPGLRPTEEDARRGGSFWYGLMALPVAQVLGAWAMYRGVYRVDSNYLMMALVMAAGCLVSAVVCWMGGSRHWPDRFVALSVVGAAVTRMGLAPMVALIFYLLFGGTFVLSIFFGLLGIIYLVLYGSQVVPILIAIPAVELVWGEVCAIALWRSHRISGGAAVAFAILQVIPVIGLVVVAVMTIMAIVRRNRDVRRPASPARQ